MLNERFCPCVQNVLLSLIMSVYSSPLCACFTIQQCRFFTNFSPVVVLLLLVPALSYYAVRGLAKDTFKVRFLPQAAVIEAGV